MLELIAQAFLLIKIFLEILYHIHSFGDACHPKNHFHLHHILSDYMIHKFLNYIFLPY